MIGKSKLYDRIVLIFVNCSIKIIGLIKCGLIMPLWAVTIAFNIISISIDNWDTCMTVFNDKLCVIIMSSIWKILIYELWVFTFLVIFTKVFPNLFFKFWISLKVVSIFLIVLWKIVSCSFCISNVFTCFSSNSFILFPNCSPSSSLYTPNSIFWIFPSIPK